MMPQNFKVGGLVLINTADAWRLNWPFGRILETYQGAKDVVRTMKLKTRNGEMIRPASKLAILEDRTIRRLINSWPESAKLPQADICYYNFESCFVEAEHVFVNQYGIIKAQFKMSRVTIFILYFWYAFFWQYRSKKSRENSYIRVNRFFNMKKFYSWKSLVKSSLHDHYRAAFIVKSFLPEVISRSQLPRNSKILYLCFRRKLLQNWHGSDWSLYVLF